MSRPLRDLFAGLMPPQRRGLVEVITPRRTFEDVILPPATYRALHHALAQIRHDDLIFRQWGLGERHTTGLGLAFNFAGAPGTGKTICAEAIAHALGKQLLVVRYAEMESMWIGETGKNVAAVFRLADEQNAVLFFDEADAIASRRFTSFEQGAQREMNTVVNVLLRELDEFPGVVIFATNLAMNFDPAFERRIRTHILFERPGADERERIWRVQLHPQKTPLAPDVDFRALAERFDATGGDIKNAVLKAAQMAAAEAGADATKRIHQRHFVAAMEEVLAARRVMEQSLFDAADTGDPLAALGAAAHPLAVRQDTLEDEIGALAGRLVEVEDQHAALAGAVAGSERDRQALEERIDALAAQLERVGRQARRAARFAAAALALALLAALAAALV